MLHSSNLTRIYFCIYTRYARINTITRDRCRLKRQLKNVKGVADSKPGLPKYFVLLTFLLCRVNTTTNKMKQGLIWHKSWPIHTLTHCKRQFNSAKSAMKIQKWVWNQSAFFATLYRQTPWKASIPKRLHLGSKHFYRLLRQRLPNELSKHMTALNYRCKKYVHLLRHCITWRQVVWKRLLKIRGAVWKNCPLRRVLRMPTLC